MAAGRGGLPVRNTFIDVRSDDEDAEPSLRSRSLPAPKTAQLPEVDGRILHRGCAGVGAAAGAPTPKKSSASPAEASTAPPSPGAPPRGEAETPVHQVQTPSPSPRSYVHELPFEFLWRSPAQQASSSSSSAPVARAPVACPAAPPPQRSAPDARRAAGAAPLLAGFSSPLPPPCAPVLGPALSPQSAAPRAAGAAQRPRRLDAQCIDDMRMIFGEVQAALLEDDFVLRTQVKEGPMGGVTTILVEVLPPRGAAGADRALREAAARLLVAAARSDVVFPVGSGHHLSDGTDHRFTASLAVVPTAQHAGACWDTYRNGVCPRPLSCRKKHPTRADMMELMVICEQVDADSGCGESSAA